MANAIDQLRKARTIRSTYTPMTSMTRLNKRIVSLWLLVAMVFMQLAVSAYACPMLADALHATTEMVSADPCCDHAGIAQPGLCQKYCQDGQQNVSDSPAPLPALTYAAPVVLDLAITQSTSFSTTTLLPSLLHATSPPLSIRHCCFRI